MSLEVRLEKAAKPEKWDIPSDISLRNALERSLAEDMSRLVSSLISFFVAVSLHIPLTNAMYIGWNSGDDEESEQVFSAEPVPCSTRAVLFR